MLTMDVWQGLFFGMLLLLGVAGTVVLRGEASRRRRVLAPVRNPDRRLRR